jgi:hypothetical protein
MFRSFFQCKAPARHQTFISRSLKLILGKERYTEIAFEKLDREAATIILQLAVKLTDKAKEEKMPPGIAAAIRSYLIDSADLTECFTRIERVNEFLQLCKKEGSSSFSVGMREQLEELKRVMVIRPEPVQALQEPASMPETKTYLSGATGRRPFANLGAMPSAEPAQG